MKNIFIMIGFMLLAGCNNMEPVRDPLYAPATPVVPKDPPSGNGAIYQTGHGVAWFEDMRARRVGDLLTVKLVEKTTGSKAADTELKKNSSTQLNNATVLGVQPTKSAPGFIPFVPDGSNFTTETNMTSAHSFKGEGDASQSNMLQGEITVSVIEVLPNGNMKVRGEKRIGINKGNEYIKVSGIVRPQDVDTSNTVLSTKIADPTLVYVGDGPMSETNSIGWLARFFIGAMMPF